MNDRLREDRCCRGAVAGELAGLDGDLFEHLRADVLEPVGELDFLRDRDPVLADPRSPEGLVENDVAPLRSQCDLATAEGFASRSAREAMLDVAQTYERMADDLEGRLKQGPDKNPKPK
jgi:hypothetical protein